MKKVILLPQSSISAPFESAVAKASVFAEATTDKMADKTADKIGFDWL